MKLSPMAHFAILHHKIVKILEGWDLPAPTEHDPQTEALQKITEALVWAEDEIFRLKLELRAAQKRNEK